MSSRRQSAHRSAGRGSTFPTHSGRYSLRALRCEVLENRITPVYTGEVHVAVADLNGDRYPDLIAAAGVGLEPRVQALSGADGSVIRSWLAYDAAFTGGVNVATGDVTGDGVPDVVTGAGPGGGPHVKVFDGATGAVASEFFAFAPSFLGGVSVTVGDVTRDGRADIVTGAGAGGAAHVRAFDGLSGAEVRNFFAFDPTLRGGVSVAVGDVTGDGHTDIVTGAGRGGGPAVHVFDGVSTTLVSAFFAFDPSFVGGVDVAVGYFGESPAADILTTPGVGGGAHVRAFRTDGRELVGYFGFDTSFRGGLRGAAADLDGNGVSDFVIAPASGGGPHVRAFAGDDLRVLANFFAFPYDGGWASTPTSTVPLPPPPLPPVVPPTVPPVVPPVVVPPVVPPTVPPVGPPPVPPVPPPVDTTPPVLSLTAAPPVLVNHNVNLTGSVTDAGVGVGLLEVAVDGGAYAPLSFASDGSFAFTTVFPLDRTADGMHSVSFRAADLAGNVSAPVDVAFTLDTTPPVAPAFDLSVTSDTDPVGDHQTAAGRVTLVGHTDPLITVTLLPSGAAALANSAGAFQFPGFELAVGDNALTAQAVDAAGNVSTFDLILQRLNVAPSSDVVLDWNRTLLDAVRRDASPPTLASRNMAMVQGAVYDAVSAIGGTPGFFVQVVAPAGASPVAAAAAAAHRALSYLYPAQQAIFDTALVASLAQVPDGQGKTDGVALGQSVGDTVIALRSNDGWDTFVDYVPGTGPGAWQFTPPMYAVALSPQWATLQPFAMTAPDQFRPQGPPDLASQEWADAYNEVRTLGSATGSTRTTDHTQIARFWADGSGTFTPPGHWNRIAGQVAESQANSLADNARLFAQLNIALADAAIAAWNVKFEDGFWRPVTAIRAGDTDGNTDTTADPVWTPLLVTPPFPEYVSGHSTFSGAAATVLTAFFGDGVGFTTDSSSLPGVQRTFGSFQAAAEEAGQSRIYGGIHYQFANRDGQDAGRALGNFVLDAFATNADTRGPQVVVTDPQPGLVSADNVTLTGRVLDNLTGVRSLEVQLDDGTFAPVAFDALGNFTLPTAFALDGSADGSHVFRFRATDFAGNASIPFEFPLTLDTVNPTLEITAPVNLGTIEPGARLTGTLSGTGSAITSFSYHIVGGPTVPVTPSDSFDVPLDLSWVTPGSYSMMVVATDAAGNGVTRIVNFTLLTAVPLTVTAVTPAGGADEVGVTFRPKVVFSRPIDVATLNADNLYLTDTTGTKLAATIVPAADGTFAWLFVQGSMPGASTITLTVDGSTISALDGSLLDAAGTGTPGSLLRTRFTTVSTAPLPNTSITGLVADPGVDLKPMTFDDLRIGPDGQLMTADDLYLNPIVGAKVFILGLEGQFVLTDAQGRFALPSVPSGNVKLVIDGRTATNAPAGTYYPEMVMDMGVEVGRANTVMGSMGTREQQAAMDVVPGVYLPRLRTDILQTVSPTGVTTIGVSAEASPNLTPEQRALLSIQVEGDTLIGADGQPLAGGQIGISTVPPELVRDMLPPGVLQHTFDITIQAPGISNFRRPAPMTFPNVFNAAPGTQLNVLSFDHTSGRLVIEGNATVSADGLSVTTDPGTGITHPGWHGVTPPGACGGSGGPPVNGGNPPTSPNPPTVNSPVIYPLIVGENGSLSLTFVAPALPPNAPPPPPPNCNIPPNPTQNVPSLYVDIAVDGPLAEFMQRTGSVDLTSQKFTLTPYSSAQLVTFAAAAKSFAAMSGALAGTPAAPLRNLNTNVLYGSKITVTQTRQEPGVPATTTVSTYYLYRFIDATDPSLGDGQIEFEDTVGDGPGGVTRSKPIELRVGASALPTLGTGSGTAGLFSITTSGNQAVTTFDPDPVANEADRSGVLVLTTPDTTAVPGAIELRGTASPVQKLDVNTAGLKELLRQMAEEGLPQVIDLLYSANQPGTYRLKLDGSPTRDLSAADPAANIMLALEELQSVGSGNVSVTAMTTSTNGGFTSAAFSVRFIGTLAGQPQPKLELGGSSGVNVLIKPMFDENITPVEVALFDDPSERAAIANGVINEMTTQFSSFVPGVQVVDGVAGDPNAVTIRWEATEGTILFGISRVGQEGDGVDSSNRIIAVLNGMASDSETVRAFKLSDAVNTNFRSPAWVYVNNVLRFGSDSDLEQSQLIHSLAGMAAHEIGHVLGLPHSNPDSTDLMFTGSVDLTGSRQFRIGHTSDILRLSLNVDWDATHARNAINFMAAHQSQLPDFDNHGPPHDPPAFRSSFQGPRLVLTNEDGRLVLDDRDFGRVMTGGAGEARLTLMNIGSQPVDVSGITLTGVSSAFSLTAGQHGGRLEPGESLAVDIEFRPPATGSYSTVLRVVTTNVANQLSIGLAGTGQAPTPTAVVATVANNLGGVRLADAPVVREEVATVTNLGAEPLRITGVRLTQGGPFHLVGIPTNLSINPVVLGPGETFSFGAVFTPDRPGLQRGLVEIETNDPNRPVVTVSVVGTGLAPVENVVWGADYVTLDNPDRPSQLLRTISDKGGNFSFFLPERSVYHLSIFDTSSGLIAHGVGTTPVSGIGINLTSGVVFHASMALDSDFDGLPDDIENAIGTSLTKADTDGDGIDDFNALQLGLDPLGGRAFPTGVISSLPLQGQAKEVVAEGSTLDPEAQTAYVATGTYGLAVVEASRFQRPLVLGQLDLAGDATDVSVDSGLRIVAVASNAGGLHFVDISGPTAPQLRQTINVNVSQVEIVNGIAYATVGTTIQAYDLLTGELRESLSLGGSAIIALAREGTMLYTLDTGNRLRAIDIGGFTMTARGTLTLPAGGGKLFVGNNIAYVGAGGGFVTANVSDPNTLVLLSGVDAANIEGRSIVANGSGLAVAVGSVNGPAGPINALDVLNVADPTNTNGFLTRINLPSAPNGVALAAGIAFVANGTSGLQVVNYQAFDNRGVPPTVTINTTALDVDPATPGLQVIEGTTLPIRATISDDVQVRNVELLVNGQVVANDVSFPFDFAVIAPAITPESNTVTIQVRVTDTGGNTTLSDALTLTLVPDTIGPAIVSMDPADGSIRGPTQRTMRIRFSEALDEATVSNATFRLLDSLGNQVLPQDIGLRSNGQLVQLTFDTLALDSYQLVIDATKVTDRGGNVLGAADVVSHFTVGPFTILWTNPGGGDWNNPNNWDLGRIPNATDDVLIDVPNGDAVITHTAGTTSVRSLVTNETFSLSGGTFSIAAASSVKILTQSGGTLSGLGTVSVSNSFDWTAGTVGGSVAVVLGASASATIRSGTHTFGGGQIDNTVGVIDWQNGVVTSTAGNAFHNAGLMTVSDNNATTYLTGGVLENAGTVRRTGSDDWYFQNGSSFINLPGATFDIQNNGQIYWFAGSQPSITNQGTFKRSAGTGTFTVASGIPFSNQGSVQVLTGTVDFSGGGTDTGSYDVSSGAAARFTGGTRTLQAGVTFTGVGFSRVAGADVVVAGVVSAANFSLDSGRLLGTGTVSVSNTFNWNGGTLGGSVSVVLGSSAVAVIQSGTHTFDGGQIDNTVGVIDWQNGVVTSTAGHAFHNVGLMTVSDNNATTYLTGGVLENAGTVRRTGSDDWYFQNGSSFINLPGATFDIQNNGQIYWFAGSQPSITNQGTFKRSAGTGTFTVASGIPFSNQGSVQVLTGTVNLSGGGTDSGSFDVSSGAATRFTGGTRTLQAGVTFTGVGYSRVAGADVVVAGAVSAANFALDGGRLLGTNTVSVSNLFNWTGGTLGGSVSVILGSGAVAAINGGTHTFGGGQIDNTVGVIDWQNGVVTSTAGHAFHNVGLMTVSDNNATTYLTGGVLENAGTVRRTGSDDWYFQNGSSFINLPGATFDIQNNGQIYWFAGSQPSITNQGTFKRSAGTGTFTVASGIPFSNQGSVQVLTGTVNFSAGLTQTAGSIQLLGGAIGGGLIDIQSGTLSGSGTISASVRNAGTIRPGGAGAGRLTITGNYTQLASGILDIELGGLTAGSQYDQLVVSGSVTLDGTLNVSLISGFSPALSNFFQVVTFASRTGTFTTINGLDLGGGAMLTATYNATDLTLTRTT